MSGRFAIETVFRAIDRVSQPFNAMQQNVRRVTERMSRNIGALNAPLTRFTKGLGSVGKRALQAGAAYTASIVASTVAMAALNRETAQNAKLAESVSASATFVDNVAASLRSAGFETDNVIDLIEEMNNKLGESAGLEEISSVTESLGILGLKFREIKNLKPEDQFKAITNAALKMEDAQKAAAAADILMGGEANKMIGILRTQGATLDEVIRKQGELNLLTDKGRAGAVKFDTALGRTKRMIGTLSSEMAGLIGEQLVPLIKKMNAYILANKELIKTDILKFFDRMKTKAKAAWEWLNEEGRVKSIGATIERVGTILAEVTAFLVQHGGKVAVVVGGLIALNAVLTTFIGIMTAVNLVMALNPIGLIVIGVAALIAGIVALVAYREEVSGFLKEFAPEWLVDYWMLLPNLIGKAIDMVREAVGEFKALSDIDPIGDVKGFFGFGDDDEDSPSAEGPARQMVSPQERTARTIEETRRTTLAEVLIRDETGRAEMSNKAPYPGVALDLVGSGGF